MYILYEKVPTLRENIYFELRIKTGGEDQV